MKSGELKTPVVLGGYLVLDAGDGMRTAVRTDDLVRVDYDECGVQVVLKCGGGYDMLKIKDGFKEVIDALAAHQ